MRGTSSTWASRCSRRLAPPLAALAFFLIHDTAPAQTTSTARPPALFEAGVRKDWIGRITVPVKVNGQGPFRFVLDTGANKTTLTPKLAATLGLAPIPDIRISLNGVTGSALVPTVLVDEVSAGEVALRHVQLPLADSLTEDIDGILGTDAVQGTHVLIDLRRDKVIIRNSRHVSALDGYTRISARFRFGQLLAVNATIGHVAVDAIIDTGSEHTLGNGALSEQLGLPSDNTAEKIDVVGETLVRQLGIRRVVPVLRMGGMQITNPQLVFGDFHVFKLWGLDSRPAIVLGMDMLGSLDGLVIDYQRGEIQVRAQR